MNKKSFTMAEILLSLTIIGVVAAITLPSLTGNINEKTWNTQKKALYARISQAIALMGSINIYGNYQGTNFSGSVSTTVDTAAETFITEGLSKVLKMNNVCDSNHLADCGISPRITNLRGGKIDFPRTMVDLNPIFNSTYTDHTSTVHSNDQNNINTSIAAFETINGESIAVVYNPYCLHDRNRNIPKRILDTWDDSQVKFTYLHNMCASFIYDLNGRKGPNTVGKDIGSISVFYPTGSIVIAPDPLINTAQRGISLADAAARCASIEGAKLPNLDEAMAMGANKVLYDERQDGHQWLSLNWTAIPYNENKVWAVSSSTGKYMRRDNTGSSGMSAVCVRSDK